MATDSAVASDTVRNRPVYYPKLGEYLAQLREGRGWSQRQAADMADRKKLDGASRQVLLRLENGQVKDPDQDTLKSVALLYEVPFDAVFGRFINEKYGRDLPGQAIAIPSRAQEGHDARTELRRLRAEHTKLLRKLRGIANTLLETIDAAGISAAEVPATSKRPRTGTGR